MCEGYGKVADVLTLSISALGKREVTLASFHAGIGRGAGASGAVDACAGYVLK